MRDDADRDYRIMFDTGIELELLLLTCSLSIVLRGEPTVVVEKCRERKEERYLEVQYIAELFSDRAEMSAGRRAALPDAVSGQIWLHPHYSHDWFFPRSSLILACRCGGPLLSC